MGVRKRQAVSVLIVIMYAVFNQWLSCHTLRNINSIAEVVMDVIVITNVN